MKHLPLKKYYSLLLLFIICMQTVQAQKMTDAQLQALNNSVKAGKDPYFIESRDTFSTKGPDCITRDVVQDRNGNIWLATWKGIIKYDGKVFTNYTLKDGLIHFHIASCYEDKKGNLWFGTARGGIYRFDGKLFKLFTTKDGLADNSASASAEDGEGNIWFATENGASRYDGKKFINFTVTDGLPNNKVSDIMMDKNGKLWFACTASTFDATDGGLATFDGKSFSNFTFKGITPFTTVYSLFEDNIGTIWLGGMKGLSRYDGTDVIELEKNLCYYIIADKDANVWLTITDPPGDFHPSTPNQMLCKYDGTKLTKVIEKFAPGDCQIFGKTGDKYGNIWFGTMKGVCRYDGKTFEYFRD